MKVYVRGIGTALPEGSLTQHEAAEAADYLRRFEHGHAANRKLQVLSHLYRKSGVQNRHSVLLAAGDETPVQRQTFYLPVNDPADRGPTTDARMQRYESAAPVLARLACERALAIARTTARHVKHLVTVSCSGFAAPGFDLSLYPQLGLAPDVSRTHVGFMGCHGALNGLRVAKALALSHPGESVLLCATELCTLHHQYTDDPQQIVANSLFADGSAALVVQSLPEQPPEPALGHVVAHGSYLIPDSTEMMTWRIGDHGFRMTLSPRVPAMIGEYLRPWLTSWLEPYGLTPSQIAHWAIHPGGPRILTATGEAIGLSAPELEVSAQVLAEFGNMSSPTILFILDRLLRRPAGPCVALAFGPGLVVEAALLHP